MAFSSYSASGFGFPSSLPPKPPTPYSFQGLRQQPNDRSSSDDEVIFNRETPVFNPQLKTVETVKRESQPPSIPITTQSMPYAPPTQLAPFFPRTLFNPSRLTFGTLNYANVSNQPSINNGSLFARPFVPDSNANNPWKLGSHQDITASNGSVNKNATTKLSGDSSDCRAQPSDILQASNNANQPLRSEQVTGDPSVSTSRRYGIPKSSVLTRSMYAAGHAELNQLPEKRGTSPEMVDAIGIANKTPSAPEAKRRKTLKDPQPPNNTGRKPRKSQAGSHSASSEDGTGTSVAALTHAKQVRNLTFANPCEHNNAWYEHRLVANDKSSISQLFPKPHRQLSAENMSMRRNVWHDIIRYLDGIQGVYTRLPDCNITAWKRSCLVALHEIISTDPSFDFDTALKQDKGCVITRYMEHAQKEYKARKAREISDRKDASSSSNSAAPFRDPLSIGSEHASSIAMTNNDQTRALTAQEIARIDKLANENSREGMPSIFQGARESGQTTRLDRNDSQLAEPSKESRRIEPLDEHTSAADIRETPEIARNPALPADDDLSRTNGATHVTRGGEVVNKEHSDNRAPGRELVSRSDEHGEHDYRPAIVEDESLPVIKREPSYVRADIITNVRRPSPVRSLARVHDAHKVELDEAMEELQEQIIRGMAKHVDWEDPRIALWETEMSVRRISKALEKAKDAYAAQSEVEE